MATMAVPGEYAVSRPLDFVQIDHTQVDIIVVDDLTRAPLPGRPWLTLAIDVFSHMVTGLHVSMSAPSRVSVACAFCTRYSTRPHGSRIARSTKAGR